MYHLSLSDITSNLKFVKYHSSLVEHLNFESMIRGVGTRALS